MSFAWGQKIMRKIKLYIAASLNGKIADPNGAVDWLENLPNPDKTDYGYTDFLASIDTTIQGYKTYKQLLDWGIDFPYPDKSNFVFTTNPAHTNTQFVRFVSEKHREFVAELKAQSGKDIWLIGGGTLNSWFVENQFINELQVFVMPIVLNGGIDLFEQLKKQISLELVETKIYKSGAVLLTYWPKENK